MSNAANDLYKYSLIIDIQMAVTFMYSTSIVMVNEELKNFQQ